MTAHRIHAYGEADVPVWAALHERVVCSQNPSGWIHSIENEVSFDAILHRSLNIKTRSRWRLR